MSDKRDQNITALAKADFVAGSLFGAVTGVALHLAPDLELAPKEGEDEVDHAIRLLGDLSVRAERVTGELVTVGEEIVALKRSISGHKGMGNRLRNQVAALEAELPAKPRKFAPIALPLQPAELLELIDAAETVELVFVDSDGREIKGLAPRTIDGGKDAWKPRSNGLALVVPDLKVSGPGDGRAPFRLGGYALLLDGELAAMRPRDPYVLRGGGTFQLKGDVIL